MEPTIPAEASRQSAEQRAGVYDDEDGLDPCFYCDADPCQCDAIYDTYRDREFDHDEY